MLLELRIENLLLIERAELRPGAGLNGDHGRDRAPARPCWPTRSTCCWAASRARGSCGRRARGVRRGRVRAARRAARRARAGRPARAHATPTGGRDRARPPGERRGPHPRVRAGPLGHGGRPRRRSAGGWWRSSGSTSTAGSRSPRLSSICSTVLRARAAGAARGARGATPACASCERASSAELRERAGTRDRDLDLLAFEIEEIEALDPSEEERAALLAERERCRQMDGLRAAAGGGAEAIAPRPATAAVGQLLAEAERLADAVAGRRPGARRAGGAAGALRIEAEDLGGELRRYAESLEAEPGRLQEVEERLEPTTGWSASTAAAWRRCWRTPSAAGPSATGSSRPRWRPSAPRPSSPRQVAERDERGGELVGARGRGAPRLAERCARSWVRWRWRTPPSRVLEPRGRDRARGRRARGADARARTRACPRRRSARRPRAASCRA